MMVGRRFATLSLAVVLMTGLLAGCGAEGNAGSTTTTGAPKAESTTTVTEPAADEEEGLRAPGDDCYVDEDGHGPDCDEVEVEVEVDDDCYIDEDGHGPDCDQEGLGGPDDLRYLSGWDADGSELDVGTVFTLTCEPNGTPGEVWGTDPYSDESSLCTAAVHAGRITVKEGGTVGGERIESRRTMPGGRANGINSQPADNWRGAIEFF